MEEIELILKAKHFLRTNYAPGCEDEDDLDCKYCAIEKAIIDQVGTTNVWESVWVCRIEKDYYNHIGYFREQFIEDRNKSILNDFDDTIIRKILLTKIRNPNE